jgi:hypothetical protein
MGTAWAQPQVPAEATSSALVPAVSVDPAPAAVLTSMPKVALTSSLTLPLLFGGLSIAGLGSGVSASLMSRAIEKDLQQRSRGGMATENLLTRQRSLSTISYVCYGVAAASAVTAVTAYFLPAAKRHSLSWFLSPSGHGASARISGRF